MDLLRGEIPQRRDLVSVRCGDAAFLLAAFRFSPLPPRAGSKRYRYRRDRESGCERPHDPRTGGCPGGR